MRVLARKRYAKHVLVENKPIEKTDTAFYDACVSDYVEH